MAHSKRRGTDGLTDKERLIAFGIDRGLSDLDAYRLACPESKATDTTATSEVTKIKAKPKVQTFLKSLQAERRERHQKVQDEIVAELRHWMMYDPRKLFSWTPNGVKIKPSAKLSAEDARLIEEVMVRPGKDGVHHVKVKPISRMAALDKLCRIFGMYQDGTVFDPADAGQPEAEKVDADAIRDEIERQFAESADDPAGSETVVH